VLIFSPKQEKEKQLSTLSSVLHHGKKHPSFASTAVVVGASFAAAAAAAAEAVVDSVSPSFNVVLKGRSSGRPSADSLNLCTSLLIVASKK